MNPPARPASKTTTPAIFEGSRDTVKKYLRAGDEEPRYTKPASSSKLDPYADKLSSWLLIETKKSRKQRRTLLQIHTDQV